jgi:hypothetical protein
MTIAELISMRIKGALVGIGGAICHCRYLCRYCNRSVEYSRLPYRHVLEIRMAVNLNGKEMHNSQVDELYPCRSSSLFSRSEEIDELEVRAHILDDTY